MAAKSGKTDTRDLLNCSICMEAFKNPKCLPCIHTFCLACLEKYGEDERPGDEMPCPTCRRMFRIPSGGFKEFPNNIFIEQIIASRPTTLCEVGMPSGKVMCQLCDKSNARKFCVECGETMCDACSEIHKRQRVSRSHKVVSLSEIEGSQVYTRARPTYCETHKEEQLKLYCLAFQLHTALY